MPNTNLIVGEKIRDATDPGQPVGATFLAILGGSSVAVDRQHRIKFSLVTTPASSQRNSQRWLVRLTIQRVDWNIQIQLGKIEPVKGPEEFWKVLLATESNGI